jgi:magnesium chelatase subunit I
VRLARAACLLRRPSPVCDSPATCALDRRAAMPEEAFMSEERPRTLGELRASGYRPASVREEMRRNLVQRLRDGAEVFPGIVGYDDTVVPQLQNAVLSGQDIILLGERGQAKTRIIRSLTNLLDEWTPTIDGADIPENPFAPISTMGRRIVADRGDDAPIAWLHRRERYGEKLATPDITIADLIGEVDPIKIAEGRYLSDELTIHYGIVPRTNRGIFAINELPDLAERIQVGLLNVMEERDIQIRGFKVRLDLDVMIVATANPEDYTNRGRIITPLKDRYGAQIRTHYPPSLEHEIDIMVSESTQPVLDDYRIFVPSYMKEIVAELIRAARRSPDVSQRSGVSVRATVACYEALVANALRRAIRVGEDEVVPRMSDLPFVLPSLQGKVEFETMEDGREDKIVARLLAEAVKSVFERHARVMDLDDVVQAFDGGAAVDVGEALPSPAYRDIAAKVAGLPGALGMIAPNATPAVQAAAIEFILEGLHLNKKLNKHQLHGQARYRG